MFEKKWTDFLCGVSPFDLLCVVKNKNKQIMSKGTHFVGQPLLTQLLKFLDKDNVLRMSRKMGTERYVKTFDGWQHLVVMLYAVIMRFDSLREIMASTLADAGKLGHLGIKAMPRRSTLADANKRRSADFFGAVYNDLYAKYHEMLSTDSRKRSIPDWMRKLYILDSTTISLFSNLIFKGVGRNPNSGKKKGGFKVHKIIHALERVACNIKFTSAATHDSIMFSPNDFHAGQILAIDRAYIDFEKLEALSKEGVIYVTKLKSNLKYKTVSDVIYMGNNGMAYRTKEVIFTKELKNGEKIQHHARIITYPDVKIKKAKDGTEKIVKAKLVSLLTNDFDMEVEDIINIYRKRWEIETLFKQIKQNFPLRYFYGESANAIKIQIWVTLIANLLLTLMQRTVKRSWSFSGMATMVRILLMKYVDYRSFFENPEKEWQEILANTGESPPQLELQFD